MDATAQAEKDDVSRRKKDEQDAADWAQEVARLEAETDRILAEQRKRDVARFQTHLRTPPPKSKMLVFDKLNLFTRRRVSPPTHIQPETPTSVNTAVFSHDGSRGSSLESAPSSPLAARSAKSPFRDQPLVFSMPFSAVNGSDRVSKTLFGNSLRTSTDLSYVASYHPLSVIGNYSTNRYRDVLR